MKTVAIIGNHPDTRGAFDFSRDDCDVWVFNEAMTKQDIKRADAVFQMHQPTIWRSSTNRNDPKHYEWLQNADVDIWMIDKFEDVPRSIKYPLSDALGLAPGFGYFTSSVAYAIALAILKEYDRIELYGVEMETGTEYTHQRVGVAFWLGVAVGKGIEVEHYTQKFWTAPLYGYEGNARIDIELYEKRIEQLKKGKEQAVKHHGNLLSNIKMLMDSFVRTYKTDLTQLDRLVIAAGQSAVNFGMTDGAIQVCEKYLNRCKTMQEETGDYTIVRQEYEGQMMAGMNAKQEEVNKIHVAADRLERARKKLNTNANKEVREKLVASFKKHLDEYIKHSTLTGVHNGVFMENREILMYYDQLLAATGQEVEGEKVPNHL